MWEYLAVCCSRWCVVGLQNIDTLEVTGRSSERVAVVTSLTNHATPYCGDCSVLRGCLVTS